MKIVGAYKVSGDDFTTFFCDIHTSSEALNIQRIKRIFKNRIKSENMLRLAFRTTCQGRPVSDKEVEKIVGITFTENGKIKCLAISSDVREYLTELETLFLQLQHN